MWVVEVDGKLLYIIEFVCMFNKFLLLFFWFKLSVFLNMYFGF